LTVIFFAMKQTLLIIFLLFLNQISFGQTNALENGLCYKIGVTQNGVYKLDGNFLKKNGIDIAKINPKNIHLFGNGAGMLPQANSAKRPNGLTENSILFSGESDNKFDPDDYLLFYGQSPHKTIYNTENQLISQITSIYSDTSFYFLVVNETAGLRIQNAVNETTKAGKKIEVFDDYYHHELESKNIIGKSGREWFGEEISATNNYVQVFDLKISGIVQNSLAKITTAIVGETINSTSNFKVIYNDVQVQTIEAEPINDYIYGIKGSFSKKESTFKVENISSQKLTINLEKNAQNSSRGFLDFFGFQTKRELATVSDQMQFRSFESILNEYSTFSIKNTQPNLTIWDITNPLLPKNQQFNNDALETFTTNTFKEIKEYIAFSDKNYLEIKSIRKINNQNIRAYQSPDLLIITTKKFKNAAQKLANHRIENDKLAVEVVDIEQVYNEFSSGMPDVTAIRDLAKYFNDQPNSKLKYLLLFADANYDIRNKDDDSEIKKIFTDFIPAYQSRESLDNVKSYSSEDYYGFLEENEGEWLETESNNDNHTLDIGVGRIPVKTEIEAEGIVDKIIYYDTKKKTIGNWRTKIALSSDDGDGNLHQYDSEDLADVITQKGTDYQYDKIYVDAFPRLSGSESGKLSPEGSKKISNTFKKGALIFNYIGHGGASNLSDEKILTRDDVGNWQNLDNMPLMVTATCEFGRYDNPGEVSGAEKAILNPNGGAIALLTTTRPVYSITNKRINEAFYSAAFTPINGTMPRLGDILRPTKNNSFEFVYNRNFTLLGDPSMKLAYPEHKIILTKNNGKSISEKADTLKALQKIELEGEIRDFRDDILLKNFTGEVSIKIFDKETTLKTLGNNSNTPMNYKIFQDVLYNGKATVTNGSFKISFTLPKDINYKYGFGRIEMYANTTEKTSDAVGVNSKFIIGGTQLNAIADTTPPTINAYFDTPEFKNGSKVSSNPTLFVNLKDESGININLSAVGHEIAAKLDGKTTYILNEYISPIIDNSKEINVKYQLQGLEKGMHVLELSAWDIYNNSTTISLEFEVKENNIQKLTNVFNYPNPVAEYTTVQFDHNFIGEDLSAKISIMNLSGKILSEYSAFFQESESPLTIRIPQKIGNNSNFPFGIYPYSIELKAEKLNKTATGASKLIVIE
jgi:Peptidase family C25